jgi:hypothetical protein
LFVIIFLTPFSVLLTKRSGRSKGYGSGGGFLKKDEFGVDGEEMGRGRTRIERIGADFSKH